MQSILSIHDVMPATMDHIVDILNKLPVNSVENVYLLVVPGLDWSESQLRQLHQWQADGYQIAGHGWTHKISKKTSFYHYLHSFFISRDVAEHLSLTSDEVMQLVNNNFNWFIEQGFKAPELYVPPAWAMGKLSLTQLNNLPFRFYEASTGIYDSQQQQFKKLPLTGYEADRDWRKPILSLWNNFNVWLAGKGTTLRISVHPFDLTYPLASDIHRHVKESKELVSCSIIFGD